MHVILVIYWYNSICMRQVVSLAAIAACRISCLHKKHQFSSSRLFLPICAHCCKRCSVICALQCHLYLTVISISDLSIDQIVVINVVYKYSITWFNLHAWLVPQVSELSTGFLPGET